MSIEFNYKKIEIINYLQLYLSKQKNISFDSKIPNDITQVIDKWELYSKHKKL